MQLDEWLIKKRISPPEFAVKCKIGVSTMYRILRGGCMYLRTARIIEKNTNGEVTIEELMKINERKK